MLLKTLNDLDANGRVGDWCFMETTETPSRLILFFRYPVNDENWKEYYRELPELNRGDVCSCPLTGDIHPMWQWDGNREAPTLSPSILVMGGKDRPARWHGYLRAGKLETA
jgi:Family of unknown function (DUF6527)